MVVYLVDASGNVATITAGGYLNINVSGQGISITQGTNTVNVTNAGSTQINHKFSFTRTIINALLF